MKLWNRLYFGYFAKDAYERGLEELKHLASLAAEIGYKRVFMYILPFSGNRPFEENF